MNRAATKDPFAPFQTILTEDKPLAPLTAYGIGGTARRFLEPADAEQLAAVVRAAARNGTRVLVLGGGCNLLVAADPVEGAVISTARLDTVRRNGEDVTAGAGAEMPLVIRRCVEWGLGGLEGLAGIPGTVGGFVAMNAGGRYGEVADHLTSVELVSPTGEIGRRAAGDLALGYRTANLEGAIVTSATFRLRPDDPDRLGRRFRQIMEEKRTAQPYGEKSPGCAFKNPPGDSAGRLIEEAGMKGAAAGGAVVSERHANFILNRDGAGADDVLALLDRVRDEVKQRSGIDLELELKVWK